MFVYSHIDQDLVSKVVKNSNSLVELFSKKEVFQIGNKTIYHFYDDKLKGMYDHNFSYLNEDVDEDVLTYLLDLKEKRNEKHLKITLFKESEYLKDKDFECEKILTMIKNSPFNIKENKDIEILNIKDHPELIQDVIDLENKYYSKYGLDFNNRRWNRYLEEVLNDTGFNIFMVYKDNLQIGHCYTYFNNGVVALDTLLVDEAYRKQYVASTLIKYVSEFYSCPIYLHADQDESAKEMYYKLGFETIEILYDYLKLDEDKEIYKVHNQEYEIIKLLGHGKGGYSYLTKSNNLEVVLKKIHHEPCDYYNFGNKIEQENNDYQRLVNTGIRIPKLIDIDFKQEIIIKEYIEGDTIFDLIKNNQDVSIYLEQVREMARLAKDKNLNIDYFPTNFVVRDKKIYYIDYECNEYHEEWNFENWGIKYWSKTKEFNDYLESKKNED